VLLALSLEPADFGGELLILGSPFGSPLEVVLLRHEGLDPGVIAGELHGEFLSSTTIRLPKVEPPEGAVSTVFADGLGPEGRVPVVPVRLEEERGPDPGLVGTEQSGIESMDIRNADDDDE
jgi:hypothetical protein